MMPNHMATTIKRMPNTAKQSIEDSIAIARQGIRVVKEFHQHSMDPAVMHKMMELLGLFEEIENKIKSIRCEETK